MKVFTKRIGTLALVFALAVVEIIGTCFLSIHRTFAENNSNKAYKYFYTQISVDPIADRFYKAFETLYTNGELKKGKLQYDLIANNVSTKAEVAAYVNGGDNNRLAKSFGMGRDAFYMDHPDLFYADLFSTSISAGMQNGEYVAYLDTSRALTMYRSDSMNSEALINAAIINYDKAVTDIVNEADKLNTDIEKINFVNNYIGEHNVYGFGTKVENGRNVDTPKADFIHTSYGALVNKESVCEGYAKSFKAVMDRLNIPCVCVQGYASADGDGNLQPHMWNYVQLDDLWYAVDVTYNSASSQNPWILKGGQTMFSTHLADGSVSSSGFELRYPALKPYDYGVDTDENGMSVIGTYTNTESEGKTLNLSITYNDKGVFKLEEDNMYLAYSYGKYDGNEELEWTEWVNLGAIINISGNTGYITTTDSETIMSNIATSVKYIRFALFKRPPDKVGDIFTGNNLVAYDTDKLTDEDFWIEPSAPYYNEGFNSYNPAPGPATVYPSNGGALPVDKTYEISVVYNTKLALAAGFTEEQIYMDFYTSRGNDSVKKNAKLENFKWDGDKTITFTFTPSKMYIHNLAEYFFTPVGLVGAVSYKNPDPVRFFFKGKSVVCSKIFNDGRLYMNVFGEPNLLDNSDVSITDFKDENGNYFAESQRSQLILVANKPDTGKLETMDSVLKQETGIKDNEIVASASYEIDLQICGVVKQVPNGSYMQVAFGFPEGYSPDDAGTTFKIYHYKHDNKGNITGVEEIPVIITEYGLIAKVQSFSPFTIVQVKNSSAAVTESKASNIYAFVNGETGGTITSGGKSGISQVTDKITYDITPDEGYTVASVRLNGKVLNSNYYKDGKLTLSKSDIQANNMLEVTFMTQEFSTNYANSGFSVYHGVQSDYTPSKPKSPALVIVCCVAVVVVAGAAVAIWFVLKKTKEPNAAAATAESAKPKAKTTGTTAKKTTAARTVKTTPAKITASKPAAAKSAAAKTAPAKKPAANTTKSNANKKK